MGFQNISVLRDSFKDQTIYIIASGPTLDYIDWSFFYESGQYGGVARPTIVINEVFRDIHPSAFVFAHHRETAQEAISAGWSTVASEYCRCDPADGLNLFQGHWYQYKHPPQPKTLRMDLTPLEQNDPTSLIVGSNTVTSALDFAGRILGARTLVLCGVDSGSIDGRWNYRGYNGTGRGIPRAEDGWLEGGTGVPHIRAQVSLLAVTVAALRKRGINVYSLNPFIDLGLEGHVFAR